MEIPRDETSSVELRAWFSREYDEETANAFPQWNLKQLLSASKEVIVYIAGQDVGLRLFSDLNTIRGLFFIFAI